MLALFRPKHVVTYHWTTVNIYVVMYGVCIVTFLYTIQIIITAPLGIDWNVRRLRGTYVMYSTVCVFVHEQLYPTVSRARAGWCVCRLYSEGARFISRLGHRLSGMQFSWLFSVPSRNFEIVPRFFHFIIHHSSTWAMPYGRSSR